MVKGLDLRRASILMSPIDIRVPLELMYSVEFPQIPYITVGDGASMDTGSISKRFPLCFMLFVQTIAKIKVETAL